MKSGLSEAQKHRMFAPIAFGAVTSRNRIVMAPMVTNFATPDNEVTDHQVTYYTERALGGVGTIWSRLPLFIKGCAPLNGRSASMMIASCPVFHGWQMPFMPMGPSRSCSFIMQDRKLIPQSALSVFPFLR